MNDQISCPVSLEQAANIADIVSIRGCVVEAPQKRRRDAEPV
jgi:hypothetical protein